MNRTSPIRTFPVAAGLLEHKQRMGIAIWEFLWLVEHITEDRPDGGKYKGIVRHGQPISAAEIARDLNQSVRTTESNLTKLEHDAYIKRHLTSDGYSYIVMNSKRWIWKRTNKKSGKTAESFAGQEYWSEETCRPLPIEKKLRSDATKLADGTPLISPKIADGCAESCRSNKEERQSKTNTEDKKQDNAPAALFEDRQLEGTSLKKKPEVPPVRIPDWVPTESWLGYVEMRTKIKRPLTPRAVVLAIAELEKLRDAGYPPGAVLDQSVLNSWQGLFPLREHQRVKTQTKGQRSVEEGLRLIAEMQGGNDDVK